MINKNNTTGNISAVIAISKVNNVNLYTVVSMDYRQSDEKCKAYEQDGYYDWSVKYKRVVSERDLIARMLSVKNENYINIEVNNKNEIVGKGASLSRFINNKNEIQYVILSKLINNENRTIGYKVASSNGTIKNIPLEDLISYSLRTIKKGLVEFPVQNAAFNISKENPLKLSYYSAYPNNPFLEERIFSGKKANKVNRASIPNKQNAEEIAKMAHNSAINKQENKKETESKPKMSDIFTKEQLWQIYVGKNNGIDFRVYANPSLSVKQMQILREGLESKLKPSDIRMIAFPEFKEECMLSYITDLKNGLDIKKYLNPKFNLSQLYRLAEAVELGLNVDALMNENYTANQMSEILLREKNKVFKEFN